LPLAQSLLLPSSPGEAALSKAAQLRYCVTRASERGRQVTLGGTTR